MIDTSLEVAAWITFDGGRGRTIDAAKELDYDRMPQIVDELSALNADVWSSTKLEIDATGEAKAAPSDPVTQ